MRPGSVTARLIGFAAVLAALFGAGLAAGQAIDPSRPSAPSGASERHAVPDHSSGGHPATTPGGH